MPYESWQWWTHFGVVPSSPVHEGRSPSVWCSHGSITYGWQPSPPYRPPVTRPFWTQYSQAACGKPPLHPLPQTYPQQERRSSEERSTVTAALEWIQVLKFIINNDSWSFKHKRYIRSYLSVMASEAPKAQHDPQLPWSRISPIEGQFGQASRESKFSGRFSFLKDLVFSWLIKFNESSACHCSKIDSK